MRPFVAFVLACGLLGQTFFVLANAPEEDASTQTRCEKAASDSLPSEQVLDICRLELTGRITDKRRMDVLEALGKVYLSQNETELAVKTWIEASQYSLPDRSKPATVEKWVKFNTLIGQTYSQKGQNEEAEKQFIKTRDTAEAMLGRYSLPVGIVQDSLGTLKALMSKEDEAREAFRRSRIIHEIRLGKYHPRTIETRLNSAVGLLDLGHEDEAMKEFEILAEIINPRPEFEVNPIRAEVLTFLGTLQMRVNRVEDAIRNYSVAYEIREKAFGSADIRTSQSLNNLGVVLYRAGNLQKAEEALSRAYIIRREKLGLQDPLTLSSQKNLQAVIAAQQEVKAN